MVTKPIRLLKFLENLEKFLNTFGVQREKDVKRKFHPTEVISRVKEINDFLERCEQEVREVAGPQARERTLQGPDDVCSVQTSRDVKLTIQTLERICSTLHEISPSLLDRVNLKSLTTLVVEDLFAEMRQGNEMPLVLQFAHRFSSAVREYMPKPCRNSTVTRQQLDEMRTWKAEYGQSARQQTDRNMATKDSAGTLPYAGA